MAETGAIIEVKVTDADWFKRFMDRMLKLSEVAEAKTGPECAAELRSALQELLDAIAGHLEA